MSAINSFKEKLAEMNEMERIRFIQAHSEDTINGYPYLYQFTEDELTAMREAFAEDSIALAEIQKELDLVREQFKERMKPLKARTSDLLEKLTDKAERRKEDVYVIHDHEGKRVYYVNAKGEVALERPFMPKQQASLLSIAANE